LIGLVGHEFGGIPGQIGGAITVVEPPIRTGLIAGGAFEFVGCGTIDALLGAVGGGGAEIVIAVLAGPVGIGFRAE